MHNSLHFLTRIPLVGHLIFLLIDCQLTVNRFIHGEVSWLKVDNLKKKKRKKINVWLSKARADHATCHVPSTRPNQSSKKLEVPHSRGTLSSHGDVPIKPSRSNVPWFASPITKSQPFSPGRVSSIPSAVLVSSLSPSRAAPNSIVLLIWQAAISVADFHLNDSAPRAQLKRVLWAPPGKPHLEVYDWFRR